MGDWLHCYSCFLQPDGGTHFNLTSCSHIFCQKCLEKGICRDKCAMCGSVCSIIPLTGKMKPEIDMYFKDPYEIIGKFIKRALEVLEFQGYHRGRYVSYLRHEIKRTKIEIYNIHQTFSEKFKAVERAAKECLGFKEQLAKAKEELNHLREENLYLKNIISEKGLSFPSPGTIRSQRASPNGRMHASSKPLSRGPSPIYNHSKSPMNMPDHTTFPSRPLGKSPGIRSSDMSALQLFLKNMSSEKMPEYHSHRVPSPAMQSFSQQGYPISHPASLSHNIQQPDLMSSSILHVRTPSSGGCTGTMWK